MSTLKTTNIAHPSSASNNIVLDSSGNVVLQAGTAAAPALQPTGDTNTGVLFPAADTVAISTGGSERARCDSAGRLLVGTTTATANGGVLQVSNGITFPATQSACSDPNTLDDYEEGTFTVTISGSTSGSGTVAATTQYIKIGRQVTVWMRIGGQAFPTYSGNLRCSLPFTSSSADNYSRGPFCYHYPNANWDTQANFVGFYPTVPPGSSHCEFGYKLVDGDWQNNITSANTTTSSTAGLYLEFLVTYYIA